MQSRRAYRSSLRTDSRAFFGAFCSCTTAMPAMMPMIATTIRSSMRVNPLSSRISPVLVVRLAVQGLPLRRGVHVVDVLVSPGGRIRLVLERPEPPVLRGGHRVDRDPAQELDLLPQRSRLLDPVHERVEIGRVALGVHAALLDDAGVAELLVHVDGRAHGPQ